MLLLGHEVNSQLIRGKRINKSEPTIYASGFTNIIDIAFAEDGTLYALEIATNSLLAEGPGGLWTVPPGGGTGTRILTDPLLLPGGIAIDDNGALYITNLSIFPDGQALRVDGDLKGGSRGWGLLLWRQHQWEGKDGWRDMDVSA